MSKVLTQENFEEIINNGEKKVLVDFWASWCGPCRMLSPLIDEVSDERDDVIVGKVNVDEQPELAQKFGVQSIPTVILFDGGKEVNKSIGYVPKKKILGMLD